MPIGEMDLDGDLLSIAEHHEGDLATDPRQADEVDEMVFVDDLDAVKREHDVVGQESGAGRRRALIHFRDPGTVDPVELEFFGLLGSEIGIEHHSQIGPLDFAPLQKVVDHPAAEIAGDTESNAVIAATVGCDGGIDADQLAVDVDQRAATVAEIDRRVGLNEVLVDEGVFLLQPQGASPR